MGQPLSKSFKNKGEASEGVKLALKPKWASRASQGFLRDDLSSKSTVISDDSLATRSHECFQPSQADAVAAIRTANRFFDGSLDDTWPLPTVSPKSNLETHKASRSQSDGICLPQPSLDFVVQSRTPSRPVPVKRNQWRRESEHLDHSEDSDDVQYLKKLYCERTWAMFARITEARKRHQRLSTRSHVPEEVPSELQMGQDLSQEVHVSAASLSTSPSHHMIFSCDLEWAKTSSIVGETISRKGSLYFIFAIQLFPRARRLLSALFILYIIHIFWILIESLFGAKLHSLRLLQWVI